MTVQSLSLSVSPACRNSEWLFQPAVSGRRYRHCCTDYDAKLLDGPVIGEGGEHLVAGLVIPFVGVLALLVVPVSAGSPTNPSVLDLMSPGPRPGKGK